MTPHKSKVRLWKHISLKEAPVFQMVPAPELLQEFDSDPLCQSKLSIRWPSSNEEYLNYPGKTKYLEEACKHQRAQLKCTMGKTALLRVFKWQSQNWGQNHQRRHSETDLYHSLSYYKSHWSRATETNIWWLQTCQAYPLSWLTLTLHAVERLRTNLPCAPFLESESQALSGPQGCWG